MKIMKSVKRTLYAALIAVGIYASASAQDIKTSVTATRLAIDDQKPISRIELVMKYDPVDADVYIVGEKQDKTVYKARIQSLPLQYGPVSTGIALQHTNFGKQNEEIGGVIRIAGQPLDGVTGKLDVRYFPETKVVDGYGWTSVKEVFIDILGSYNTEKDALMLRPGIDYKISKNILVGLEGKVSGTPDDLKTDYIGLRVKGIL